MAARVVPERLGILPVLWSVRCLWPLFLCRAILACSQESPYIVTYDHYLEEPGSLEVEYFFHLWHAARAMTSMPSGRNSSTAPPPGDGEVYVSGQTTFNDSTIFTALVGKTDSPADGALRDPCSTSNSKYECGGQNSKRSRGTDVESDYAVPTPYCERSMTRIGNEALLFQHIKGWNVL